MVRSMVTTLAWVMGQLASIHRYFSDLLGDLGCIALFLSEKVTVTIKQSWWTPLLRMLKSTDETASDSLVDFKLLLHYGKTTLLLVLKQRIQIVVKCLSLNPLKLGGSLRVADSEWCITHFFFGSSITNFMSSSSTTLLKILYNTLDGK